MDRKLIWTEKASSDIEASVRITHVAIRRSQLELELIYNLRKACAQVVARGNDARPVKHSNDGNALSSLARSNRLLLDSDVAYDSDRRALQPPDFKMLGHVTKNSSQRSHFKRVVIGNGDMVLAALPGRSAADGCRFAA